jgi:hypothetical protein
MATRTIVLDEKNLEGGIEMLASAAHAFQLTRFERLSYRVLMVTVDVTIASYLAVMTSLIAKWGIEIVGLFSIVFAVCVLVGTVFLVLNIPLFRKASREKARLKELGLASLSESLWKQSRQSRWIRRVRGPLFIVTGIICLMLAGSIVRNLIRSPPDPSIELVVRLMALFCANIAALLFAARYLRNQRERMDLAASAEELRKALQDLRQCAGNARVVSVPSELLEQAARIESAQIANERKDAVLQSVAFRPSGYAVAFDRAAAEQRATLSVADRVELEDLVAQLSTEGAQLESQAKAVAGAEGAMLRGTTKSKRVEIEYVIDQASHGIRIIAVRQGGDDSHGPLKGASHA